MFRTIKLELRKAFCGRWFAAAVTLALLLSCMAAAESVVKFGISGFDANDLTSYTYPSSWSCISVWLGVGSWGRSSFYFLFFYALPFVSCLAYSWSSTTEIRSGYYYQVVERSSRAQYFFSKLLAAFAASFAVAAIGLLSNLLYVALFFPAVHPFAYDSLYTGMTYSEALADLYYSNPCVFVILRTFFDSCLCGAWGCIVLSIGWFSKNVAANFIVPYLGLLGVEFANHFLCAAITSAPVFEFSVFQIMQSWSFEYAHEPAVSLLVLVLMLALSLALTCARCRRDLL